MQEEEQKLESKFVYRLIKVCYIIVFFLSQFFNYALLEKPSEIYTKNTYLNCSDGKKYKITPDPYGEILTKEEKSEFRKICLYGITDKDKIKSMYDPLSENYTLNQSEKSEIVGSWWTVIWNLLLGALIGYVLLNILREGLNYLFLGVGFAFNWLGIFKKWLIPVKFRNSPIS